MPGPVVLALSVHPARPASNPIDALLTSLHADQQDRNSWVFCKVERLRRVMDGHVLTLLEERTFPAREVASEP